MTFSKQRKQFRNYLNGPNIGYPVSVFDPISARIADHLKIDLGILGGSVASAAILAAPDIMVLTLSELSDQVERICRVSDISLMVDADNGYGNALNASRTIQELERAGAAAITIEDAALPPQYGSSDTSLISCDEMIGKLRAAIDAKRDPNTVIIARTNGLSSTSLDDTSQRVSAYSNLNVDAIMIVGAKEYGDIESIRKNTHLPLVLGSASDKLKENSFLLKNNVKVVLTGHQPFFTTMKTLYDSLKHLKDGGNPSALKEQSIATELENAILHSGEYRQQQQDYLSH